MPATPRFVTFHNEFAPGLPAPGRGTKDFGKGWDGRKFGSVELMRTRTTAGMPSIDTPEENRRVIMRRKS